MRHITYKQIKFSEISLNEPFYLIHPNDVQLPAVPAVHYSCEVFQPETVVWVVDNNGKNLPYQQSQ